MSNDESGEPIRWAPKVHPNKIGQLYTAEASGLLPDKLVDEIGIALLLRVESIFHAMQEQLVCPRCRTLFPVKREHLKCPQPDCGWSTTYEEYRRSKRHRDLNVANALPAFERYAKEYPKAISAKDKMRLIDRLIHEFHWDAKKKLPNRSVGNNLIEGSHKAVVHFLDQLSSSQGVDKTAWRQTISEMWTRRRSK